MENKCINDGYKWFIWYIFFSAYYIPNKCSKSTQYQIEPSKIETKSLLNHWKSQESTLGYTLEPLPSALKRIVPQTLRQVETSNG